MFFVILLSVVLFVAAVLIYIFFFVNKNTAVLPEETEEVNPEFNGPHFLPLHKKRRKKHHKRS